MSFEISHSMAISSPISPFTGKPANHVESISTEIIKRSYLDLVKFDVSKYFENIQTIDIYECLDTKYRFYFPLVEGDALLYEYLGGNLKGYYPIWKWENDIAKNHIETGYKVLDIGCGNGEFLSKIRADLGCHVSGLEFNDKAIQQCSLKGLSVFNQSIEDHSLLNQMQYDVVCAFQVLEHVSDPNAFIKSALLSLKKGGKLIIGVPNNFPYLFKYEKYHPLNMPPHHCGLWNEGSLRNLQSIFDLKSVNIFEEKILTFKQYFFLPYLYVKGYLDTLDKDKSRTSWTRILNNKAARFLISIFLPNKMKLKGHTIVSVFTKN